MRPSWLRDPGALLGVALAVRLAYITLLCDSMNDDAAVGALMARKIARGEELSLVFWGAHCAGTFPFVIGPVAFQLFEPSATVPRLAILLLGLGGIAAVVPARHVDPGELALPRRF